MILNSLLKIIQKKSLSDLRKSVRAYHKLSDNALMARYHQLMVSLTQAPLGLPKNAFWGLLPKVYEEPAKDYLRQMNFHIMGKGPNSVAIMRHCSGDPGPFVFIANKVWRDIAIKDGMRICKFASHIRWCLLLSGCWVAALRMVVRVIIEAGNSSRQRVPETPYAVFVDLRRANLPQNLPVIESSEDLYSWWKHSKLYSDHFKSVWVSGSYIDTGTVAIDGVKIVRDPLPTLGSAWAYVRFLMAAVPIISVSFVRTLFGQWWAAVILRQAMLLAYVRLLPKESFAEEYFYNCTNSAFRPVWTHYAEKMGSRFTVIEYSHNIRYGYLLVQHDLTLYDPGVSLSTWSRHAVLDHDHASELAEAVKTSQRDKVRNIEYVEVGPIGWRDSGEPLPKFDRPAIVIMDSNPHKPIDMALSGLTPRYHSNPDVVLTFLEHAFKVVTDAGYTPVYKPKVAIDPSGGGGDMGSHYPRADKFRELVHKYGCTLIHKDTSVKRVIEACDGVIALPFSSSGVVAHLMGKPVVFYDAVDTLTGFEKYAHGCQLLHTEEKLRNWVESLHDNDNLVI